MAFKVPEPYRLQRGILASDADFGNNGMFIIPGIFAHRALICAASDSKSWEHVSVQVKRGEEVLTPYSDEMKFIKQTFWDPDDIVVQYYPSESDIVEGHPVTILHLWRPVGIDLPLPLPFQNRKKPA